MADSICFGKLFDENEVACSPESCDAREECQKAMLNISERKISCMGTFDPSNRACTDACTKNKECQEMKEGKKLSTSGWAVTKPVTEEVKRAASLPKITLPKPEQQKQTEPVTVIKSDQSITVEPKPEEESSPSSTSVSTPKEPKTGKISKKSVVRDNIRILKRFKADDLVQAIINAGLGDDTAEDMKKNRTLVQMWISEFNKTGLFKTEKDGEFYVLKD